MATWVIDGSGAGGATPRRRFSDDDKARIVSEAMMPGASVADVARRHRICTSLVYRWRRVLLRDGVAVEVPQLPAPTFVPVELASAATPVQRELLGPPRLHLVRAAPAATPVQRELLGPGVVEVVGSSGHRIRLAPPIDARVLKAVLAGFG